MFFYKANAFAIKWVYRDMNADAFAMFILDKEGRATGIEMKGISPNIDFSFDFQDSKTKFNYVLPTKFISSDGLTMWLAWSGWPEYDSLNFIKCTLKIRGQ